MRVRCSPIEEGKAARAELTDEESRQWHLLEIHRGGADSGGQ
jgi:hypothetical protein